MEEGVTLGTRVPTRDVVGRVEGEEVGEALALPHHPPPPAAPPWGVAVPLPLGPEGVELELGWVERVDVPLVLGLGVVERVALVDPVPTGHPPPPTFPVTVGGAMDPGTVTVGASCVGVGKAEGLGRSERGALPVAQEEGEGEEDPQLLGLPLTEGLPLCVPDTVPWPPPA